MKSEYEKPEIEVIIFDETDVIVSSKTPTGEGEGEPEWDD